MGDINKYTNENADLGIGVANSKYIDEYINGYNNRNISRDIDFSRSIMDSHRIFGQFIGNYKFTFTKFLCMKGT